jgi:hypothetical protein
MATKRAKSPNNDVSTYIGYAKFTGPLVESGLMDARKSAQALIGFDEAIRTLVGYQDAHLKDVDFELPVRVREGSWEILLPTTVVQWILSGAGVVATTYLATAAAEVAKKDFKDVGTKDIFRGALRGMQWMLRIGKHMRDSVVRSFPGTKFRKNNAEVGLVNAEGKVLWVPKGYLHMYADVRTNLLTKLADLVEDGRTLVIGVVDGGVVEEEKLPKRLKSIFVDDEEDKDEVVLPELKHGSRVDLEGDLTRGNEISNTLGLKYKGHVLILHPKDGSIVRFKSALFGPVRVRGVVSRLDEFGKVTARNPHLTISRIVPIKTDEGGTPDLFNDFD